MPARKDEIICFCEEVTYETIRRAILDCADTVDKITDRTNAGLACGTCIEDLENILDDVLNGNQAIERKR